MPALDDALLRWLVDAAIAVVLAEMAVRAWRSAASWRRWLANLAAGLALMVALRLAVVDAGAVWIVACLAVSGLCHLADRR